MAGEVKQARHSTYPLKFHLAHVDDPSSSQSDLPAPKNYGCWGGTFGGCLLPLLLYLLAAASGDTGGILFWPLLVIVFGLVGSIVGLNLHRRPKR
jgi:hypothetical protein